MKRIVLWITTTLSALVILFSYRTSLSASTLDTANSATLKPITITSTTTPSTTGSTSSSVTPSSGAKATTATATKTAAATPKTVTGSVIQTRWGPVQVQLTVSGGKITAVTVLQYPTGGQSDQINAGALPILVSETMKAQSTKIDMVSGATYTSNGYLQSLQSALDQAGL